MTTRKRATHAKAHPNPRRRKRRRPLTGMNTSELAKATAEFDQEFVVNSFEEPNPVQKAALDRAKRKRGRPRVGEGVKVISVSIERRLLAQTDRLAKKLKVPRAALVSEGLRAVVNGQVPLDI